MTHSNIVKKSDKTLVRLSGTGKTMKEMHAFGQLLVKKLGDEIFNIHSKQLLLFHLLIQISPINKNLKRDEKSINDACGVIMRYFGMDNPKPVQLRAVSGEILEIPPKRLDNTTKFCEFVIEMDKVPADVYEQLSVDVNKDLIALSELIKWYETQACIKSYLKDNRHTGNHEYRIYIDYYKRCISERIEILNYQLYGMKKRALIKSKKADSWSLSIMSFEWYHDRPYHFSRPLAIHYFDCRQIDLVDHRLSDFLIPEARLMQKLYYHNKLQFYRKYFKKIPVQQHFQNFQFYLPYLPLKNNRKIIFDELVRLFKAHRWISFYALALPQVEGLFSEMCYTVSPDGNISQKALTYKVNAVRDYHSLSAYYFDYYQYHIPLQRNKFSHTGYDDDFKLKSYDLLVDLSNLLKIFSELESPLVKIKRLFVRRKFDDFVTIKDFVDYFKLIKELKPKQIKEIESEMREFEGGFLTQDCTIEYTCTQLLQDLPQKLEEFISKINETLRKKGFHVEFDKLTKPQIDLFLKDEKSREVLLDCFSYYNDIVETLENSLTFLIFHKKYLPSLSNDLKSLLELSYKEYGKALFLISETRKSISIYYLNSQQ